MVCTLLVDSIGTPFSSFTYEDPNFVKKNKQSDQIRFFAVQLPSFLLEGGEGRLFLQYMDRSYWESTEIGRD